MIIIFTFNSEVTSTLFALNIFDNITSLTTILYTPVSSYVGISCRMHWIMCLLLRIALFDIFRIFRNIFDNITSLTTILYTPVSSYVRISCRLHRIMCRLLRIASHYDRMRAATVKSCAVTIGFLYLQSVYSAKATQVFTKVSSSGLLYCVRHSRRFTRIAWNL